MDMCSPIKNDQQAHTTPLYSWISTAPPPPPPPPPRVVVVGTAVVVVMVEEVEESCLKVYPETLCCAGELPTARESQSYEPAASTG